MQGHGVMMVLLLSILATVLNVGLLSVAWSIAARMDYRAWTWCLPVSCGVILASRCTAFLHLWSMAHTEYQFGVVEVFDSGIIPVTFTLFLTAGLLGIYRIAERRREERNGLRALQRLTERLTERGPA